MRSFFIAFLVTACGSPTPVIEQGDFDGSEGDNTVISNCVPGETKACVCINGENGAQNCNTSGTYDSCVCEVNQGDTDVFVGDEYTVPGDTYVSPGDLFVGGDEFVDPGDTFTIPDDGSACPTNFDDFCADSKFLVSCLPNNTVRHNDCTLLYDDVPTSINGQTCQEDRCQCEVDTYICVPNYCVENCSGFEPARRIRHCIADPQFPGDTSTRWEEVESCSNGCAPTWQGFVSSSPISCL